MSSYFLNPRRLGSAADASCHIHSSSPPSATDSASLRPEAINRISSNSANVLSPSDIVGPSPVTSNGTETTEIEDDASEDVHHANESDMSAAQSDVCSNFLSLSFLFVLNEEKYFARKRLAMANHH